MPDGTTPDIVAEGISLNASGTPLIPRVPSGPGGWIWKKKLGPNDKGTTKLSPDSQAAYRAVNLHFHDLRHEGAARLLEAGWLLHHIQHMLGHAPIAQTSTYLNATVRGLHKSMQEMEQSRAACKPVAKRRARAPPA